MAAIPASYSANVPASQRNLLSEKRFYVLIGNQVKITPTIRNIVDAYSIMDAKIVSADSDKIDVDIDIREFGTFCHIDTEANITNTYSRVKGLRYFGYVNGNQNIISFGCSGYVGIPVSVKDIHEPGMWEVSYPHITLVAPMSANKFNDQRLILGASVTYELSEVIRTKSAYSHSALIDGENHHVTRLIIKGQRPYIAKTEMEHVIGTKYDTRIGFPVLM